MENSLYAYQVVIICLLFVTKYTEVSFGLWVEGEILCTHNPSSLGGLVVAMWYRHHDPIIRERAFLVDGGDYEIIMRARSGVNDVIFSFKRNLCVFLARRL